MVCQSILVKMGSFAEDVSLSFDSHPGITAPQHRRPPAASSQGPAFMPVYPGQQHQQHLGAGVPMGGQGSSPPNMAFMSFDLSNTGGFPPPARVGPPVGNGGYGASQNFGQGFFEDEPPLLEELGINIPQIMRKTVSALNPLKVNPDLFDDGDLSGPLMFIMLFGFCQLLAGKVHFGVILGWSASCSALLWTVVNLMSGSDVQLSGVELYRCCSLFGYSLLPMVAFSALSLFLSRKGMLIFICAAAIIFWCSRTCSNLLLALLPQSEDFKLLIVYMCALIYSAFALLVVF